MSPKTVSLKKSLSLTLFTMLALQLTACKEQKTTSSAQIAGKANPNAKKEAADKKNAAEKAKTDAKKSDKKDDIMGPPAPDQIPAVNTSGNAWVGSLASVSSGGNEKLTSICSLELVEQEGKKYAFLVVGGYQVKMPLKKEWVKDSQSIDAEAIKASSSKVETMTIDKTTQINYKVQVSEAGLIEIRRELFFADENALGNKDLNQFIQDEKKNLYEQKDYRGLTLVTDFFSLDQSESFTAFTYTQKTLIAGTGAPEKGQSGKVLSAACEGLKSEKK